MEYCYCLVTKCVQLFCDPIDYGLPGPSVHGISEARILEWVAISLSRGSSRRRDQTHISYIGMWIVYQWDTREVHNERLFSHKNEWNNTVCGSCMGLEMIVLSNPVSDKCIAMWQIYLDIFLYLEIIQMNLSTKQK